MVGTPSLVTFSGSCTPSPRHTARPASDTGEDVLGDVEPEVRRPEPGELRLDDERAAPRPVADFTANVVASAADTMAMLAEHRATRPLSRRPSREARILTLVDAIFATGERAISDLLDWWERAREGGATRAIWPPIFLLGLVDGPTGLLAIERLVESLRPDEAAAVEVAADALSVVPHARVAALAEDLLEAANPLAQAVGLEALSRRGDLVQDRAASYLDTQAPVLLATALRALARIGGTRHERTIPLLRHADPAVAWEAARALTLLGAPDALEALRAGEPLAVALGPRAAEVFVMAGEADDIAHIEAIVARSPVSAAALDAIGRFGNPLAWSFLLHFLADRELAGAAEAALLMLFGPLVPDDATRTPGAWRDALAEGDLDPAVRYRRGAPWTPAAVVRDCTLAEDSPSGTTRSQRSVERWLDELAARTGIPMDVDLSPWTPAADKLRIVTERAQRVSWRAGAWNGTRDIRGRRGT
jgi:hypothetical protein